MSPAKAVKPRGTGHANLIYMEDFATGDRIFRVETDIHRGPENAKLFDELVKLQGSRSRLTVTSRKRMVVLTNAMVKLMSPSPSNAKAIKGMFSKAFGF